MSSATLAANICSGRCTRPSRLAAPTTPVFVGYAPIQGEKDGACSTELPPTAASGYAPGSSSCSGHTRAVIEGSAGFIYRFYNSPTKGRIQYSMVYSYLTKEAWGGSEHRGYRSSEPEGDQQYGLHGLPLLSAINRCAGRTAKALPQGAPFAVLHLFSPMSRA